MGRSGFQSRTVSNPESEVGDPNGGYQTSSGYFKRLTAGRLTNDWETDETMVLARENEREENRERKERKGKERRRREEWQMTGRQPDRSGKSC